MYLTTLLFGAYNNNYSINLKMIRINDRSFERSVLLFVHIKNKGSIYSEQSTYKYIDERDYLAGVAAPASLLTRRVRGCNEFYHLK